MLEVLEFIFSSFWRWLGFAILLAIVAEGAGNILQTIIFRVKK